MQNKCQGTISALCCTGHLMVGCGAFIPKKKTESNKKRLFHYNHVSQSIDHGCCPRCFQQITLYAIGSHETPELIKAAMRNAINHTAELFSQRYNLDSCSSIITTIKSVDLVYEACTKFYTPVKVKNAKAKHRSVGISTR
jgi:hypothetical protein